MFARRRNFRRESVFVSILFRNINIVFWREPKKKKKSYGPLQSDTVRLDFFSPETPAPADNIIPRLLQRAL